MIGQKNRAGISVANINVADAVLLLILTGKLVLFDRTRDVFINRSAGGKACLRPPVHRKPVDVIAGAAVLNKNAVLLHFIKGFSGRFINYRRVMIHSGVKVDFRPVHTEEGIRVILHHFAGFFAGHYVIGQRRHLFRKLRSRAHSLKGSHI